MLNISRQLKIIIVSYKMNHIGTFYTAIGSWLCCKRNLDPAILTEKKTIESALMSNKNDFFLREKTKEITSSLLDENSDMYDSIGSVHDIFSSPYNNSLVASDETIDSLWFTLLDVFFKSKSSENRFDAISALNDIYCHCIKCNKILNLNLLREWRSENNDSSLSEEILECIDDMLV